MGMATAFTRLHTGGHFSERYMEDAVGSKALFPLFDGLIPALARRKDSTRAPVSEINIT